MKRIVSLFLALCFALTCGTVLAETNIIVFAAASLTETLTEIIDLYEAAHPGITIICNFDSSGTLKTQIEEGAECDVFISASPKQMNALETDADVSFLLQDSRIDLLENKVVLVAPEGADKGIDSFDALAALLKDGDVLLCMGNSDVPVGQYTQKILAWYGLDEQALADTGKLTYGSNVKEVTTQVSEASVDCGIIYATDASSAGLAVIDEASADMCGQVIYPAAVLNASADSEAAMSFLTFLTGEEASQVFMAVEFTPISPSF